MATFPRSAALSLAALALAPLCLAQTPVNFSVTASTSGRAPGNIYSVDLNNDGITDLVQDTEETPSGFSVSLGNGDGTFRAPVFYTLPSKTGPNPIATGDFNNDGKVDIAVAIAGTNQILVYLGNGNGTLQAPKTSTIALPSGYIFNLFSAAASDFNGDGKVDFVANAGNTSGSALFVIQGDGAGGFTTPHVVLADNAQQVVVGDFDGDGKADIATTTVTNDAGGFLASTTVHALYGNGAFGFTDTTPYINNNGSLFYVSSGDLNSDGMTDLFGTDGNSRVAVLYGSAGRTFSSYFLPLPVGSLNSNSGAFTPLLTMADYNGDGRMDIAAFNSVPNSGSTTTYNIAFFLATGSGNGQFTSQTIPLSTNTQLYTPTVSGLFSRHLTPDVALSTNSSATSSTLLTAVNRASSGYFGPCYYPSTGQGFNVCVPFYFNNANFTVDAAVNSYGKLRKIELWIDGKKISEQHHVWDQHGYFAYSGTLNPGAHKATLFAVDVDNRLQRYDTSFVSQGGPCTVPSSPGVNVCNPVNNGTTTSPVLIQAASNITGTLARMEVWIDGVKVYTETTSTSLGIQQALPAGKHQIGVYAVNTAGTKWLGLVNTTVQ
ncbi:VCBS repeat-containing protein [Acidobacteria bacterium AB60]|nr:VCBS repeat-containing protein [Acidobacteria bacterium AB60]